MQVTETLSEGLKRAFTVVVPSADIESRRAARLSDLGKTLRLPGFRPGKVPMPVVRQRYGTAVTAEVLEELVNQATQQVLSERGLRPAMQPKVDVLTKDPAGGTKDQDITKDLEFKVEVELLPEIALPDFSVIELTRLKAEVPPETVDKALAEIAARNRELHDISPDELGERGAEKGEVVVLDYVGRVDGMEFPGGRGTDVNVEVAGPGFIPGFTEQIEGIRPGETRTIEVTFPEEYGAKEVAGKAAAFEVTAKSLKRQETPAVDDDLAKKLGFEGLDEVKGVIRGQVEREYGQLSRQRLKRELLDKLNTMVSFAIPEGMVEAEFAQIWARLQADRDAGRLDEEDKAKDEEALRSEYRAIAERRVRLGLLLAEVGRVNAIQVTPDEMARAMRAEAARYPGQEAKVIEFLRKTPQVSDNLRGPIFEEKVVDYVLELAKVEERTVPPEELALEPEPAQGQAEPAPEISA